MVSKYPDSAYVCADQPESPQGDYGEKRVARYIVDLTAAYFDCKDKLGALR